MRKDYKQVRIKHGEEDYLLEEDTPIYIGKTEVYRVPAERQVRLTIIVEEYPR